MKESPSFIIPHSSFIICPRDEEVAAEEPGRVEPGVLAPEAGVGGERREFVERVLVGVLRVDALARAEVYVQAERFDADGLFARAFEVHLDAPFPFVVERDVAEVSE